MGSTLFISLMSRSLFDQDIGIVQQCLKPLGAEAINAFFHPLKPAIIIFLQDSWGSSDSSGGDYVFEPLPAIANVLSNLQGLFPIGGDQGTPPAAADVVIPRAAFEFLEHKHFISRALAGGLDHRVTKGLNHAF